MRRSNRRRMFSLLLIGLGAAGWTMGPGSLPRSGNVAEAAPRPDKPNILLILTDDQRADTLWAMPNVRKKLVKKGMKFEHGYISNTLCCPSRASILTGRYSHGHGVYTNYLPFGGFDAFVDSSTVATWLDEAGYETAIMGKYFNQYNDPEYVPPGWDEWRVFSDQTGNGGAFYNYALSVNGKPRFYERRPRNYSTDVLARMGKRFIERTDDPFFLHWSPFAPHGKRPAPRHKGMFDERKPPTTPAFDEKDVSDKPEWVQNLRPLNEPLYKIRTLETLPAVDEAIAEFIRVLREKKELDNTLIVFTSDNGKGWGDHRWKDKSDPYRGSANVPFVVRFDRWIEEPSVNESHLVSNIDLAPTFADVAGAVPDTGAGKSLKRVVRSSSDSWRNDLLIEHVEDKREIPTYCGVRSLDWLYVGYDTGEEELYDLQVDPYELENLAEDPTYALTLNEHRERTEELCSPAPPGYDFPFPPL